MSKLFAHVPIRDGAESAPAVALPRSEVDRGFAGGTGAGKDGKVPRTFLAFADACALSIAFLATGWTAPLVQWLLLPSGPLGVSLPEWLSLPDSPSFDAFPTLRAVAWVLLVTIPMTVLFMELLGGYRQIIDQSRTRLLISSTLSPLIALSFLTLAFFAFKSTSSSRVLILTFGAVSIFTLIAYRSALRTYKRRRLAAGAYAKNVILIGRPTAVQSIAAHFREHVSPNRYQVAGWLNVGPVDESEHVDLKLLGTAEAISALLVNHPIHEVIAVHSSQERDWLPQVLEDCDYFRVTLRLVPAALLVGNLRDLQLMFRSEPLRLPEVVLAPPHFESDALFLKRLIDVVVSASLLILFAPLFLLIAIGIKITTPGLPVFYPWRVIGLKGRPFTGYKFTTMGADADERKEELMDQNEMTGPVFKIKNDPRVTRFGSLLRKYSLNELPQLWSVLKGDMSLVGPRPAGPHELVRYELWHKRKLCVQPGITCIWQVSGRNRINNFDEWVRLDLQYIDTWSLWLDFRILVRTVWAVLDGSGS